MPRTPEFFTPPAEQTQEPKLFDHERKIIQTLTSSDKDLVRSLLRKSISKEKSSVIGVRSEDIVHFLECVHQGYIPVGNGGLRQKADSQSYLFLTANPESTYLKTKQPELIGNGELAPTFHKAALYNLGLYADIAIIQALRREIMSRINEQSLLTRHHRRMQEDEPDEEIALDEVIENFYTELLDAIQKRQSTQAMADLKEEMKNGNIGDLYKELSKTFKRRGGIVLAFGENLPRIYAGTTDEHVVHSSSEIAFLVPNGKLSLEAIAGFEVLGDFEDHVLEEIGI